MDGRTLGLWLLPPVVGGIIGYFTNDLAIRMLFRPYRPVVIGGWQLPFTPGLIPANQGRLARRIADAILGSLLTPDALHDLARRLLELPRLEAAIAWLVSLLLERLREVRDPRSIEVAADVLRDLAGSALPRWLRAIVRQRQGLDAQIDRWFEQQLLSQKLGPLQAQQLGDWLLEGAFPPDQIRRVMLDFLTDDNIRNLDRIVRDRTRGTDWVIANLFGVQSSLQRLRQFLREQPEAGDAVIAELSQRLALRQQLSQALQTFQLTDLPQTTLTDLRLQLRQGLRQWLDQDGLSLLEGALGGLDWTAAARALLDRLRTAVISDEAIAAFSHEVALILDQRLEHELEDLVAAALPILALEDLIIGRVEATPAADLEAAIQGIVRSELQAIVNIGGVLGVLLGCVQSLINVWSLST
ncbi:DUF445 domain-containing protein [Synechococcus elongatus]|uniref:UPF0754 membrane protein Synpcc7942_1098 n=1 Tax=Synechococcus elongatus (strain ATCC 33912 / PCC 7942 / FACHB-805) TaxID=1140 RepID=Y1098_SYNE7|nr:DUF445 family protein [Synechococcus elongatus]Q31P91.1 RecName: Full=UPF0754 membrane protein Synpcc7942_1098 [Synechococcus elongatus PCC 7942 = FACHB-805]ABB57128.1 conserved hypothetical protein [Synechococcus elongatus PCC 7942 = FACHB-805]AJD58356.1 membrane protein [Synechococcus elongatus UTEX 2973]MBD2587529.1 DUF445 family protein [Synechococcus elongatus FACHB-242]MBD2688692.1 DUF445 family protein [Synechococcus elongatus FACHB-1061]MBD2707763.1 DUF445 family protein [Synechoco